MGEDAGQAWLGAVERGWGVRQVAGLEGCSTPHPTQTRRPLRALPPSAPAGCSIAGGRVTLVFGRVVRFHLADDPSGELVESTIRGLGEADPELLMPMHCTGWKAVHRIAEAFPAAFALSSVGTKVTLEGA